MSKLVECLSGMQGSASGVVEVEGSGFGVVEVEGSGSAVEEGFGSSVSVEDCSKLKHLPLSAVSQVSHLDDNLK